MLPKSTTSESPQSRYIKGELIGEGAYGKVFIGTDTTNGSKVALKEIGADVSFNCVMHV